VTAEDGTTQDYVVTVSNLKNTQKQITAFTIEGQVSSAIDQTGKTILVTMPFGTDKTNLEPTITVSAAASVSPTSGAAQDFTSAKTYRVTAEDGTTQDYLVTVNNLKNAQKQILTFSIDGQVSSSIDQTGKTISVTMPFGTYQNKPYADHHRFGGGKRVAHIGRGAGFHVSQNLHGDGRRRYDAGLRGDGQQPQKHPEADY
jgi:hypothetical protein